MNNTAFPLEIIYEDNHLLVISKPAGVLAQGDRTGDLSMVDLAKSYIKEKYHKPGNVFLGLVHRLDRPVSGLIICARTSKALSRMTGMFREKKVEKTYLAIVENKPSKPFARLEHHLVKNPISNKVAITTAGNPAGKRAILKYTLLGRLKAGWLLLVNPLTGRPHQIRVQLAQENMPIVGDVKYGAGASLPDKSIALHAWKLVFEHPVKKNEMDLKAPVPSTSVWQGAEQSVRNLPHG